MWPSIKSFSQIVRFHDFGCTKGAVNLSVNVSIPAVIAFGDSYLDQGNNNKIKTLLRANFPPYGKDFIAGIPTGRFCNGKTLAEFFVSDASNRFFHVKVMGFRRCGVKVYKISFFDSEVLVEALGVKEYLPAYLDPSLQDEDLQTGVSFASGGTGLKRNVGDEVAHNIITNSEVLISASTNDLILSYYDVPIRWIEYDVRTYVNILVNLAINFVQ
ncbi:hypothetical protein Tco_1390859, partial [Tanacetum coccineum]